MSALVPYKQIDLAIAACNTNRRAPEDRRHRAGVPGAPAPARSNVEFLGSRRRPNDLLRLYRGAEAFILPGEEDFGIAALEAQACGDAGRRLRPGGRARNRRHGTTGILFPTHLRLPPGRA